MGYKRYGSSTSVPTFDEGEYEAVTAKLQDMNTAKIIYFGIKKPKSAADSDKPWRELTTDDFDTQITSDTDGCSATITQNTNDLTNKTGIITYTLSKNTTGSARLITFNYKGTTLFTITQDAGPVDNNTYVYLRYWVFNKSTYENIITSANNTTQLYRFSIGIDKEDDNAYISYETWKTSGNIIYHVTNNEDLTNIFSTATSIKNLVDNGTLTYVAGKNFDNNTISSIIKFPTKMYEENTLISVNDNSIVYIYSGKYEATVNANDYYFDKNNIHSIINWGNINNDDVSSIGKYRYNKKISNKKTYTIYMFEVLTSQFTSHGNEAFLFVPTSNSKYISISKENADIDKWGYTSFPVRDDGNKLYTYFFVETTNTLTINMLSGKTLKELKDNYNLTKVSGDMYENDDTYVNNISDKVLVNQWNTIIHKTLSKNTATDSVAKAWLYASNGSILYTNAKSSNSVIIDMNNPAGIYTITV